MYNDVEILSPHRRVRVGQRTYPAVFTAEDEHMKSATIPTENGGLVSFAVTPNSPVAHLNVPQYQVTPSNQRHRVTNPDLFSHVGTAHGVDDFHSAVSSLSRVNIDPEAVHNNQRIMQSTSELFNDRRGQ